MIAALHISEATFLMQIFASAFWRSFFFNQELIKSSIAAEILNG